MVRGDVKRWHSARGFGFVRPEGEEDDVFAHASEFVEEGAAEDIGDNAELEFDLEEDDRSGKMRCKRIKVISKGDAPFRGGGKGKGKGMSRGYDRDNSRGRGGDRGYDRGRRDRSRSRSRGGRDDWKRDDDRRGGSDWKRDDRGSSDWKRDDDRRGGRSDDRGDDRRGGRSDDRDDGYKRREDSRGRDDRY